MAKKIENKENKKVTRNKSKENSDQKNDNVNAKYEYKVTGDEKLIVDTPSEPLNKKPLKEKPLKETKKNKDMQKPTTPIKTNGQIYNAYISELKDFKLVYNGDIIYDSTLAKNVTNLEFETDYFILFGKKYSYNGLRIQKI